jgi:hypothetical protein
VSVAFVVGLTVAIAAVPTNPRVVPDPPPGERIVRQMHDRYAGKWFHTLTFVQQTTQWKKDGTEKRSTWYESASVPSLLRIDFGSPADGDGVLFTADSTFRVEKGAVTHRAAGGNDLTTLLFDVYVDPVDHTLDILRQVGYDLAKMHRDQWDGRSVYVVGADSGDLTSPQFWVDADRLIVVRQLWHMGANDHQVIDAQFKRYRPIGKSWIAPECQFFVDGTHIQQEEYSDIKADVPLSPDLFDVTKWSSAPHWAH